MSITKEKIVSIITEYGGTPKNTGLTQVQVALLTERINHISSHLQKNKKDFSSNRGLLKLVSQRKRLLTYLQRYDLLAYRALIAKLGLRK